MTFKPPELARGQSLADLMTSAFHAELAGERASELGRTGARLETSLKTLAEAPDGLPAEARSDLVDQAADATWAYFIQREIAGYRNHRDAIAVYSIPQAVLARVGVVRRKDG